MVLASLAHPFRIISSMNLLYLQRIWNLSETVFSGSSASSLPYSDCEKGSCYCFSVAVATVDEFQLSISPSAWFSRTFYPHMIFLRGLLWLDEHPLDMVYSSQSSTFFNFFSKWCPAIFPPSALVTAIRLHETALWHWGLTGPTTHQPNAFLILYGPSFCLGMTFKCFQTVCTC